ncbi:hypothetical protein XENOCAPTIV_005218, partial [Xenoophorus captivus]
CLQMSGEHCFSVCLWEVKPTWRRECEEVSAEASASEDTDFSAVSMASLLSIIVLLAVAYSGFCEEKVFLQRAGKEFNSRQYRSVLTVNNGEKFGDWTWPEICPDNFFAVGFSVRVESKQHGGDDTALNGIRLICSQDESRSFLYYIESHTG